MNQGLSHFAVLRGGAHDLTATANAKHGWWAAQQTRAQLEQRRQRYVTASYVDSVLRLLHSVVDAFDKEIRVAADELDDEKIRRLVETADLEMGATLDFFRVPVAEMR